MTLLELTKKLISFPSVTGNTQALQDCADFIADFFKNTGLTVQQFMQNGIPSVVVTKSTKNPKVFLCGHFDVVPAEEHQFYPVEKDGRLYGRGALDMKSGDAVMMQIMKDLGMSHDVGLMLTGDEESGGFDGVGYLLEQYGCQVAIIPDGGEAIHHVVHKEKGILRVEIKAVGISAHGSTPWLGESAIHRLRQALQNVESLFVPLDKHPADHWVSTCNVGKIQGGLAVNQVSFEAMAFCDIRFIETDTPQEIMRKIVAVLPEGVTATQTFLGPLVLVPLDHALVKPFLEEIQKQGRIPVLSLDHGSSDGRFFMQRGIPVLISQPDGAQLHAPDEWVDINSIESYYQLIKAYLDRVSRGGF